MSLNMTREEREAFLAGVHVGVLSIEQPGHAPLSAPVWYDYSPEQGLWFITDEGSRKGRALLAARRCTLVAQTEDAPYKYVSVSGPVVDVRPAELESHRRPMAHRYLGPEMGELYLKSAPPGEHERVFSVRPERWLTVDYAKLPLG